jgi:enolase-phosphatase E1
MALIAAVVTDIEGTTSSLAVLRDVLAPYARRHLADYVREHRNQPEVQRQLLAVRTLAEEPSADEARTLAILERWIDEDQKAPPLKVLQGLVWEVGYREGSLRAHLYPDVLPALRKFRESGRALYVYSSGSVHAQQLFFEHSEAGDVRALFSGFFDTQHGKKTDPSSYGAIARTLGLAPERILFLSDSRGELAAARAAGFQVLGVARDPEHELASFPVVQSFDQIALESIGRSGTPSREYPSRVRELCALARHCHERGFAYATSGNFSARVDDEQIAITASGRDKGLLMDDDIVLVDLAGRALDPRGRPSAETPLHCALYRRNARIGAVAHTHSVAATVLSRRVLASGTRVLRMSGYEMAKALPGVRDHETELCLPVVPNAQDMELLQGSIDAALLATPGAPGYLVAGHGLTTWAHDVPGVKRHVEALEFLLACALAG